MRWLGVKRVFPWSGCRDPPLPGVPRKLGVDPWNVKSAAVPDRAASGAILRHVLSSRPSLHKSILAVQRVFRGGLVLFTCDPGDFGRRAEKGRPTGGHRRVGTEPVGLVPWNHGRQPSVPDFLCW